MPTKSRKNGAGRHKSRIQKTKNRVKDIDQIQNDLKVVDDEVVFKEIKNIVPDDDLPGQGLHPCQACSRHFIDQQALEEHYRSKVHKKRLRELKETPYSHAEAEAAGGIGNYNPSKRRKTSHMEVL